MSDLESNILVCDVDSLNQIEKQRWERECQVHNERIPRDKTGIGYVFVFLGALVLAVALTCGLKWIFIKYNHIDATEERMHKILMQIEDNKMVKSDAIEYMLDAGFDGYAAYNRLAYTYEQNGDYDTMVDLIMYYIENNHGIANMSNNPNFIRDLELHLDDVSPKKKKELERFMKDVHCYRKMYDLVREQLYDLNYNAALGTCLELKTDGANSFEFACLYTEALIELDRIDEAFTYVKEYVCDYSTFQNKETDAKDREKLLQFIRPHLQEPLLTECDKLIQAGFDEEKIHSSIQYPKKYCIKVEEAKEIIEASLIEDLQWLSYNDDINIDEETVIFKGIECLPFQVVRKDGGRSVDYTLYMDAEAEHIFIVFGEKYSNIYRGATWWGTKQNEIYDKSGMFRNSEDGNVVLELSNYRYLSENYSFDAIEFIAQGNDPNDVPADMKDNEYALDIRSYYDDKSDIRLFIPEALYSDALIHGYSDDVDVVILLSDKPTLLVKKDNSNSFLDIEGIYEKN